MIDLKNKVAFITGGNRGIGFGIAETLINQGMNVAITSRTKLDADKAAAALNTYGVGQAIGFQCDVRRFAEQEIAVKLTQETFGKIDVLIANAGVGCFSSIENLSLEQWNEVIDTNLSGVFYSIKAGLDALKNTKGYLISISSLAGANFFETASAYNASKFGVTGFTQAIMLDLRKFGIKVSTIMPGSVASNFNNHQLTKQDDWKIQPEDIGQIVSDLLRMNPRALPSKIEVRPSLPPTK